MHIQTEEQTGMHFFGVKNDWQYHCQQLKLLLQNPVYTIQLVVKLVEQPTEWLFTWCSWLFNRFRCSTSLTTAWTTGCIV